MNPDWDVYKENIQPISQGRKIGALMQALQIIDDNKTRQQVSKARKEQFDKDLESEEDHSKRLDLWEEYIDWLEQNVPDGGKINGITNAIESCIEQYYDKKEFKQDARLFDIFMKFKRFCDEPIEIFGFMYANSICTLLARFYLNWSWQYEIRKNMKRAEDLIKLGLKNLASPREVLLEAAEQIKHRTARMIRAGELDEVALDGPLNTRATQDELASSGIRAALQTLKFRVTKKKGSVVPINRIGQAIDQCNVGGLKSQTKVVNGVRVPTKSKPSAKANKPVSVFNEDSGENNVAAENENAVGGPTFKMPKIPTSQRIQSVGRSGAENEAPRFGRIIATSKPGPQSRV